MIKSIGYASILFLLTPPFLDSIGSTPNVPSSIIHSQVKSLGLRENGRIHAWVYLSDKGTDQEELTKALVIARDQLTPRARRRRAKVLGNATVSFRDLPLSQPYLSKIVGSGALLRRKSKWLNAVSVSVTPNQLDTISQLPFVIRIDPVLLHRRPLTLDDGQIHFERQSEVSKYGVTGGDTLYGPSGDQIRQINCHLAHEAGYAGQGVIVLMLDTGFYTDHESIQKESIIAEWDFINNDSTTQNETAGEDSVRQHHHGTITLSVLGGYAPGKLIGPAFRAKFLLAKTEIVDKEIQLEEDNYVAALEWGEALGADVASSSLIYTDWYSYCDMDGNTAVTTRAVDIAVSLGVVCVTSAGNEGNLKLPDNPCDTLTYYVGAPADADSVMSVGAVNRDGQIAGFSSHGPTYDGRTKPEVCALGVGTVGASSLGADKYTHASGTSLSAPLVAGSAAIILSAHPDWTPMMVREGLMVTASRADSANNSYGWGIIDVWAALHYTGIAVEDEKSIPTEFILFQNYPNPFNASTLIEYETPFPTHVSLKIFNLLGQEVITLVDERQDRGLHRVHWDGSQFSSGLYLFQMRAGDFLRGRKMVLLK